jgi:hypothetical protein
MSNRITAKEIKITMYTNIPTGNEYEKAILTLGILYRPGLQTGKKIKTNTYPFFTFQVKYDENSLSWVDYDRLLKIFFDKNEFEYNFSGYSDILPLTVSEYVKYMTGGTTTNNFYENEYYRKRTENINNNIMLMIKYMLPTKYPVVNNHFNSYDVLKGNESFSTFLFNPFKERNFIYLKLPSGTYTVVKVTWLNDVINHPDYLKLLDTNNPIDIPITTESSNNELHKFVTASKERESGNVLASKFKPLKSCYRGNTCKKELSKNIYTGIQIVQSGSQTESYELSLDVELIESEVKPEELNDMNCPYFGDYLGEELIRLTKMAIGRKIIEPGKVIKLPLYSKTTKTSRKLGYLEKEEIDEKRKAKRRADDEEYNEVNQEDRIEYDRLARDFLPQMLTRFRTKMKKYDVTIANFYFFLYENVRPLLENIKVPGQRGPVDQVKIELRGKHGDKIFKSDGNKVTTVSEPILEYIKTQSDEYGTRKNLKQISKENYDEMKFKYDLIKEFVTFIQKARKEAPTILPSNRGADSNSDIPSVVSNGASPRPTIMTENPSALPPLRVPLRNGGTRRKRKFKKKYTNRRYRK